MSALREMFPNHSQETIMAAVRSSASIEVAINRLLQVPPDAVPKQTAAAGKEDEHGEAEHIIPNDFLRWPKDVKWVKVTDDEINDWQLQTKDDIHSFDGDSEDMSGEMKPVDKEEMNRGWLAFKNKIRKGYDKI